MTGLDRGRAALLVALLAIQAYSVVVRTAREPHVDETETLHASWLMAHGGKLYETFFEHHSPFLFAVFTPFAPGELADVRPFFARARWLSGAMGLVALAAIGMLLWRVAPEAAPLAVGLIMATGRLWQRGFAEIHAEPFALAFFWTGALLALRSRGIAGGIGVGLIAISGLWTPKWPLTCAAVAIVWLVRAERKVAGVLAAAAVTALGFAALRLIVPLDVWWFFSVDVNGLLTAVAKGSRYVMDVYFQGGVPFLFCPPMFRPALVLPAALIVGASLRFDRSLLRGMPLLLLAAAFLELRFVHPWPAIWDHNYLFWVIAGAWTYALVPSSIGVLLGRTALRPQFVRACVAAIAGVGLLIAFAHLLAVAPITAERTTYWVSQQYLRERLRPGDVVWLEPARHPVSVRDAHYYWFLVGQMVPIADELRKSERGRRYLPPTDDLPACRPPSNLRFALEPPAGSLPREAACMRNLIEEGRARRTVFRDVHEMRLESAP